MLIKILAIIFSIPALAQASTITSYSCQGSASNGTSYAPTTSNQSGTVALSNSQTTVCSVSSTQIPHPDSYSIQLTGSTLAGSADSVYGNFTAFAFGTWGYDPSSQDQCAWAYCPATMTYSFTNAYTFYSDGPARQGYAVFSGVTFAYMNSGSDSPSYADLFGITLQRGSIIGFQRAITLGAPLAFTEDLWGAGTSPDDTFVQSLYFTMTVFEADGVTPVTLYDSPGSVQNVSAVTPEPVAWSSVALGLFAFICVNSRLRSFCVFRKLL